MPKRNLNTHLSVNLLYLNEFNTNNWKFNKIIQSRLLETDFWTKEANLPRKLNDWKPWKMFKLYVKGLKGMARNRLLNDARREVIKLRENIRDIARRTESNENTDIDGRIEDTAIDGHIEDTDIDGHIGNTDIDGHIGNTDIDIDGDTGNTVNTIHEETQLETKKELLDAKSRCKRIIKILLE
jgi:hypothetical protein